MNKRQEREERKAAQAARTVWFEGTCPKCGTVMTEKRFPDCVTLFEVETTSFRQPCKVCKPGRGKPRPWVQFDRLKH